MTMYQLKHLETGNILGEVHADMFAVTEEGVVLFYGGYDESLRKRTIVATTQVSESILIIEKHTPSPVLVMPKKD